MAVLLLQLSGPTSSVGGPLTIMLVLFIAMLAVAIHEARSSRRGAAGSIVSIAAALVGGLLAASLASTAIETILPHLDLEGSLASSGHPLLYVFSAAMAMLAVLGPWIALQIVNRFRS